VRMLRLICLGVVLLTACNSEYLGGCGGDGALTPPPAPPATQAVCAPVGEDVFTIVASRCPVGEPLVGSSVLADDLDGDGLTDLAIGVPGCSQTGTNPGSQEHGIVVVCFGVPDLAPECGAPSTDQCLTLTDPRARADRARFGSSLGTRPGHPNDPYGQSNWLLIGVPGDTTDDIVHGGVRALELDQTVGGSIRRWWSLEGDFPVAQGDTPEFGASLAIGEFHQFTEEFQGTPLVEHQPELAVGAPFADVEGVADAGLVQIFYADWAAPTDGAAPYPKEVAAPFFVSSTVVIPREFDECNGRCAGARFGKALTSGRFMETAERALDDLAVGVPGGNSLDEFNVPGGRVVVFSGAAFNEGPYGWPAEVISDDELDGQDVVQEGTLAPWTIPGANSSDNTPSNYPPGGRRVRFLAFDQRPRKDAPLRAGRGAYG